MALGLVLLEFPPFVHLEAQSHPEKHRRVFVLGLLEKPNTGWAAQEVKALKNVVSVKLLSPFSP